MTISAILAFITGLLQFPGQISALIKMLRQTPAEQQGAIMQAMLAEGENFRKTGRPTWS